MGKLTIGDVTLDNNVILAPMAGVTDLPFRLLCRRMGAGLVCMEMVSAKAIFYNNKNTEELLEIHPEEVPASLQLFGSDPKILADMAKRIQERPFSILDFNMGCPVPKVVNNGEGSALMKEPKLVEEILSALVKAVDKPVTVKIRKGFDEANCNAVEIARIAESCGVAAIAVHGRTREQYYSGRADWDVIAQVKQAVSQHVGPFPGKGPAVAVGIDIPVGGHPGPVLSGHGIAVVKAEYGPLYQRPQNRILFYQPLSGPERLLSRIGHLRFPPHPFRLSASLGRSLNSSTTNQSGSSLPSSGVTAIRAISRLKSANSVMRSLA